MGRQSATLLCLLGACNGQSNDAIDKTWQSYLDNPPAKAVSLAEELATRADGVAKSLNTTALSIEGEFDMVCSGGGDLNAYYLGIDMVVKRAGLQERRHGGASGGGWITFELALKGENRTLASYLSYGMLQEENPIHFSTIATTVLLQDHHWKMMSTWQANKWSSKLSELDGQVMLAVGCESHPDLMIVSEYPNPAAAAAAFYATGACYETEVQGKKCMDGSSVSGEKMTPLFQDGLRPQLIVDLMDTGFPTINMGGGKFTSSQFADLVKRGQDEASEFLRTGKVSRSKGAITWCAKGSNVKSGECKRF